MRLKAKLLTSIMLIALASVSVFALTACGNDDPADPATPTYTVPANITATYGQTLADIALPAGWAWEAAGTTAVGNAGNRTHYAVFTPESDVYYPVRRAVTIVVGQGALAENTVAAVPDFNATFGQTLADLTLPTVPATPTAPLVAGAWAWVQPVTTSVGDAGYRYFEARFTPVNDNFAPLTRNIRVNVAPLSAPTAPSAPAAVVWTTGLTLGNIALDTGWTWNNPATVLNIGTNNFLASFALANHDLRADILVPVTVNPAAAPSVTAPAVAPVVWAGGLTLGGITLDANWAWVLPVNTALNAGVDQPFYAIYSRVNHQPTAPIRLLVTVNPAAAPSVTAPTVTPVVWTTGLELGDFTLDTNWAWVLPANTVLNAGADQPFYAIYSRVNHQPTAPIRINLTITPAPAPTAPATPAAVVWQVGLTLEDIALDTGWTWNTPTTALNAGTADFLASFALSNHDSRANVSVTVTVNPAAAPSVTAPIVAAVVWTTGLELGDFTLDTNWTWVLPLDTALNAGENQHFYAVYSRLNHQPTEPIRILVTVNPAPAPSVTHPVIGGFLGLPMTGSDMTLANINLNAGWAWVDSTTPVNAGRDQTAPAVYTRTNHLPTAPINVTFHIMWLTMPGAPSIVGTVVWTPTLTLADVLLPSDWYWVAPATSLSNAGPNHGYARRIGPNYNPAVSRRVEFTVAPTAAPTDYIAPEFAPVTWAPALILGSFVFVNSDWTWVLPANTAIGAGDDQEFYAVYTRPNHLPTEPIQILLTVNPAAAPSAPGPFEATYFEGITLAAISLAAYAGWSWAAPATPLTGGTNTFPANFALANHTSSTVQITVTITVPTALLNFVYVNSGENHSLALDSLGRIWSWGGGGNARTGHGDTADRMSPTMIARVFAGADPTTDVLNIGDFGFPVFVAVAAGIQNSLALDNQGGIWAWGNNNNGRNGNGLTGATNTVYPRRITQAYFDATVDGTTVTLVPQPAPEFTAISAGSQAMSLSMALCVDGHVWTWGSNMQDRTGHALPNTTGANASTLRPRKITRVFIGDTTDTLNIGANGFPTFTAIVAGEDFGMALADTGRIWSWGGGGNGRTGHGHSNQTHRPREITQAFDGTINEGALVAVAAPKFTAISAWSVLSTASCDDGNIWTWGTHANAQTGHGTVTTAAADAGIFANRPRMITTVYLSGFTDTNENPELVGVPALELPAFRKVSAGQNYGRALDNQGNIWTWGSNIDGRTGLGVSAPAATHRPRSILLVTVDGTVDNTVNAPTFTILGGGHNFSSAICEGGHIWTWGGGANGRLGHGNTAATHRPRQVILP